MKLIYLKILKSIIIILFIWSVLSGITSYPMMFVDYPCFQSYDEVNNCVPKSQYRNENISESTIFESFLSTDYANQFGGGCAHYKQDVNKFTLNSAVGDLKINVMDNQINVNGDIINEKESYSKKKYFGLNFWTNSFVSFTYYGEASYCETNSTLKRHVIIGSYGTKHSLLKGFSILCILIISFIYLKIQTRKIKKVKK